MQTEPYEIDVPKPRRLRHSFSRMDTFANRCERLYALEALLPERRRTSAAMAKGSQIHDYYERIVKNFLAGDDWDGAIEAAHAPKGPMNAKQLANYVESVRPVWDKLDNIVSAEDWFGREDDKYKVTCPVTGETLPIVGKIDVLTHSEVVDYKIVGGVHRVKWPSEAKLSLQLKIYCLATGVNTAAFVYPFQRRELVETFVTFSEKDLAQAFSQCKIMIEAIEHRWQNGGWSGPTPDFPYCNEDSCPFYDLCFPHLTSKEP